MNRYIAVLLASKEARRINQFVSAEEKEQPEKPVVRALKRLSDEKLKAGKEEQ